MASTAPLTDEEFDFTDEEIKSELSKLGYNYLGKEQFEDFKKDLRTLVHAERSRSFSSSDGSFQHDIGVLRSVPHSGQPTHSIPHRRRSEVSHKEVSMSSDMGYGSPKRSGRHSAPAARDSADYLYEPPSEGHKRLAHDPYAYSQQATLYEPPSDGATVFDSTPGRSIHHLDDYWQSTAGKKLDQKPLYSPLEDSRASRHLNDLSDSQYSEGADDERADVSKVSNSSVIKRKVMRKLRDGSSEVYEESYHKDDASSGSSEVDSRESLAEKLKEGACLDDSERMTSTGYPQTHAKICRGTTDPARSSVIWPETKPVQERGLRKMDPVRSFHNYQQIWSKVKVPEEKLHKDLRWAVREQMLYKDVIYEKSQKKFVENTYVVPTDKKRKELRWRIRANMAAGVVPTG